jgi:superoxide dismutase, Cu-Zn family
MTQILSSILCLFSLYSPLAQAAPAAAAAAPQFNAFRAAKADLINTRGQKIGTATLIETRNGIRVTVKSSDLPVGVHGIHIHEKGVCKGPDFNSAGGHFNPDKKLHGSLNKKGHHAGDLGNINVLRKGPFRGDVEGIGLNLRPGDLHSILKAGGTSLVIHAKEDNNLTDPAGNSGARIACGIVQSLTTGSR